MKTIWIPAPNENWIVDRFVDEWSRDNHDMSAHDMCSADVIWLLAPWIWRRIPQDVLCGKKVLTTIHHIVPEKLSEDAVNDFSRRDRFTTAYHTPNEITKSQLMSLTSRPIHVIPYWANSTIWKKTAPKNALREKYGIREDVFVISSFQRDTEGSDLKSPKLEKGPDFFIEAVKKWSTVRDIFVLLAGWRRQYVIENLKQLNVKFSYIEFPSQEIINELYQMTDLYPVTSRYEGGPQALIECGLLGIHVVSRNVGMASVVLPRSAIDDDVMKAIPAIPDVNKLLIPGGYERYRELINSI